MTVRQSNSDWKSPPYDARVVANFLLHHHFELHEEVTQLRLYKLLYFAHGWYLVQQRRPLVWNNFEAWKNGPVIKVVRDNFAKFDSRPINSFASMFDLRRDEVVQLPHRLAAPDEKFIEAIVAAYRSYTAGQLSEMTHARGSPWEKVWKAKEPVGRFGLRLTNDEILTDFEDIVVSTDSEYNGSPLA